MSECLEYLQVSHRAKGQANRFDLREVCTDYIEPIVAHCLDVTTPTDELWTFAQEVGWPAPEAEPGEPVARLLVNELPVHMKEFATDSWFWFCDQCDSGPSGNLGGYIDGLIRDGLVDLGDSSSGSVLHLQNLEVHRDWRRHGIGSRLVKYALGLLSRSDFDLAVAELIPVRASYPPLFPDPAENFTQVEWVDDDALSRFLASLEFYPATESLTLPEWQLRELGMARPDVPTFYRKVTGMDRMMILADEMDL